MSRKVNNYRNNKATTNLLSDVDTMRCSRSNRFYIGECGEVIIEQGEVKDLTINKSKSLKSSIELDFC